MNTCRACSGVLGRDCYNEYDCMQISNSYDYYDINTWKTKQIFFYLLTRIKNNLIQLLKRVFAKIIPPKQKEQNYNELPF